MSYKTYIIKKILLLKQKYNKILLPKKYYKRKLQNIITEVKP